MEENKDRFFIPKTIRVGYQERIDTYTKRLAYVIYIDQTGKVRKETSWKGWCESSLGSNDFDNVPTEGFVLNKHVGGHKSDWNFRQSYCRIYDPRGFEFEITIDNLLWILDWEDCMHGKGLSGKFVYGWIADQLCLIPCSTEDYQISYEMSNKMYETVGLTKKDLIPGSAYKIKGDSELFIFVGNLKLQNKLGAGFKTQSFFIRANNNKNQKDDWDYYYRYRMGKYAENAIVRINLSSILCKVEDNALSKEEIDELIYRFSLTAYSYDFWHTKNIIKEFTDQIPNNVTLSYTDYRQEDDYKENKELRCVISDDKQSVMMYKKKLYQKNGNSYFRRYDIEYRLYKFISLNANGDVTHFGDFGRPSIDDRYTNYEFTPFDNMYKDKKIGEYDVEYVNNEYQSMPLRNCFYITKDGYFSNSLQNLIAHDNLSYVSETNNADVSIIILPTKIN